MRLSGLTAGLACLLALSIALIVVGLNIDTSEVKLNSNAEKQPVRQSRSDKGLTEKEGSHDETLLLGALSAEQKSYYRAALDGRKQQAHFFLKVIDQDDLPVANATIYLDFGGGFLSGGKQGALTTDSNGEAEILAEASWIAIEDIVHPEVEFIQSSDGKEEIFYGTQPTNNSGRNSWQAYGKDTPAVFRVWRFSELPDLALGCRSINLERGKMQDGELGINERTRKLVDSSIASSEPIIGYSFFVEEPSKSKASSSKWSLRVFAPSGGG